MYLSAEQRLNYLVRINDQGLLVWARDRRPVDTTRGKHKDLGDGRGIVDASEEEVKAAKDRGELPNSDDSSSSSSESSFEDHDTKKKASEDAHHYGSGKTEGKMTLTEKFKENFSLSPKHVMDRLLRSTLNQNTWFVELLNS